MSVPAVPATRAGAAVLVLAERCSFGLTRGTRRLQWGGLGKVVEPNSEDPMSNTPRRMIAGLAVALVVTAPAVGGDDTVLLGGVGSGPHAGAAADRRVPVRRRPGEPGADAGARSGVADRPGADDGPGATPRHGPGLADEGDVSRLRRTAGRTARSRDESVAGQAV